MRAGARRRAVAIALAVGLAGVGVSAAPAAANTYCVQLNPCPQNGPNFQTLQAALNAAAAHDGEDGIQIGPVTLHNTHAVDVRGNIVAIYGRGARTVLVADGPAHNPDAALTVQDPDTGVNELVVRVTRPQSGIGLVIGPGGAYHVAVVADPTVGEGTLGVSCDGAGSQFLSGFVALPVKLQVTAVAATRGCLVRDSTLAASTAVEADAGRAVVRRTRLEATLGITARYGADVTAEDDLYLGRSTPYEAGGNTYRLPPIALYAGAEGTDPTTFAARHMTLWGANETGGVGAEATFTAGPGSQVTRIDLRDSIIRAFASADLVRQSPGQDDRLTISIDYSDYARSRVSDFAPGVRGAIEEGAHNVDDVAPGFVDPGRDFHLGIDSPLVDIGDPAGFAPGESRLDIGLKPRIVDGDGHPGARRDMGAYEAPEGTAPHRLVKGTGSGDTRQGTKAGEVFRLGAGNDSAFGGRGSDWLFGEGGEDDLNGGPGYDLLFGGKGGDLLSGGPGPDRLFGGASGDELVGGDGLDSYDAGGGNDFVDSVDGVREVVRCGSGFDSGRADKGDTLFGCEAFKRVAGGS